MKNPLSYFEKLLQKSQGFIKSSYIHQHLERIPYYEKIDYDKGIIQYYMPFYDEANDDMIEGLVTYSFIKEFHSEIDAEYRKSSEIIRDDIFEITKYGNSPIHYINNIKNRVDYLYTLANEKFPDYPIVGKILLKLKSEVTNQYNSNQHNSIYTEDYCENSFDWDSFNEEDKINSIKRLYQLLTVQPPIIFATEEDFINAFTRKEINSGIHWLLETKNGHTSKSNLIYFIHQLKEENYIKDFDKKSFGRRIEYVFRDYNGRPLKNIKQSLNDFNKKETCEEAERIDEIISQIEQP